jgi:hypothetical protein
MKEYPIIFLGEMVRAIGNGVVPLQAAAAFVLLAQRAGIFDGSVR